MAICRRCQHEWNPRVKAHPPKRCPNCTSPAWDRKLRRRGRKKLTPEEHAEEYGTVEFGKVTVSLDRLDQAREILRRINA